MFGALPVPFMSGVPGAPVVLDLSSALDPRIAFTRTPNGVGSYFDSTGLLKTAALNVPRFTYNPATLVAEGLLIEEAKSYLFTKTEKFDDAVWTKATVTVIADQVAAPDGLITADFIREDASASATHRIDRAFTGVVSTSYLVELFAKANQRNRFGIIIRDTANSANQGRVGFDINTGVIDFAGSAVGTYTLPVAGIRALPNGWYYCWLAVTIGADTAVEARVYLLDSVATIASPAYVGDGTSGLYLWGENGAQAPMAPSYRAADAATVSRSSDIAKINDISWLNRSAGTIYIEAIPSGTNTTGNNQSLVALSDNTTSNYWHLRIDASGSLKVSGVGGTPWNSVAIGAAIVPFAKQKLAFAWDASSASVARNGAAAIGSGGAFAFPAAVSQMDIGSLANSFMVNGSIPIIQIWPYRKTDAELTAMTT